jgi:hypothetical protein
MTIASQANALRLAAPLGRTEAMTVRGVSVYGVSGGATSFYGGSANKGEIENIDIAAGGPPLPVSVSASASSGSGVTCDFSDWGEPLHVAAPPHSVPLASIPA